MSPEDALRSWLLAVSASLGLPGAPCAGCVTVLHELSLAGKALGMAQLEDAVRSVEQPDDPDVPCPGCGEIHDRPGLADLLGADTGMDLDSSAEHAESAVASLADYGAATALEIAPATPDGAGEGRVRLTPLGRMLADSIFTGGTPAADCDAAVLIAEVSAMPPKVGAQMAAPWLVARSPAAAVGELLAYAESAGVTERTIAVSLAASVGPEGEPAWREWADKPGFGAYARVWLAQQGELVTEHPGDQAWVMVEALSMADAVVPPDLTSLVLGAALGDVTREEMAETLSAMSRSGHPDAARFVDSVAALTGERATAGPPGRSVPAAEVYQLKITLRGVSKPPVWRRVTVPAALTLDLLHEVIQRAMGWAGSHLHVFTTPWAQYGLRDPELGHADERRVTVQELLAEPGDKVRYTYDFGDDWEHDIVLEHVVPAGSGAASPACLAGKGACPPEDCGGIWGYARLKEIMADPDDIEHQDMLEWLGLDSATEFDPAEFRPGEVNARLSYLT
jgi:glutathione S-transferase